MNYDNNSFRNKYRIYIYPVVLALIVTMFWRPMVADGDAMRPTLEDGQIIIIAKEKYSENRGYPKMQSIVAFKDDFYPTKTKGENSTGRVVGLPGDTIEIKDNKVYRNNKVLNEPYAIGEMKESIKVKISEDEIFILCDNRGEGIDSRNPKVGLVKMDDLRGHLALRVWPIREFGKLS